MLRTLITKFCAKYYTSAAIKVNIKSDSCWKDEKRKIMRGIHSGVFEGHSNSRFPISKSHWPTVLMCTNRRIIMVEPSATSHMSWQYLSNDVAKMNPRYWSKF